MTTVLSQTISDVTRRCDAKCHNAKGPNCECICNGMNHGGGYAQAVQNNYDLFESILEDQGVRIEPHTIPLPGFMDRGDNPGAGHSSDDVRYILTPADSVETAEVAK